MQTKTVERLSRLAHLTRVQVSLESTDPGIHDSIYGPGLHRRALQAIENLREKGVPVTVALTPMEMNERDLPNIEKLAAEIGAEVKTISLYDLGSARENRLKPAQESQSGNGPVEVDLMCEKGVAYSEGAFYPCPVFVKEPDKKLGETLEEALSHASRRKVAQLREVHSACQVCLKGST